MPIRVSGATGNSTRCWSARKIFMRDGFARASVNDIAREAEITKATIYAYFPDKQLFFPEVARC